LNRFWGCTGGVFGAIAVTAGAFGAHGLKKIVGPDALAVFETAARYQMYSAFALLAIALLRPTCHARSVQRCGWCFLVGTTLFSGSLYAMALTDLTWRFLGAVTPFGGVLIIAGWVLLAIAAATKQNDPGQADPKP